MIEYIPNDFDVPTIVYVGSSGSITGQVVIYGATSGSVTIKAQAIAGTDVVLTTPQVSGQIATMIDVIGLGLTIPQALYLK